MARRRLLSQANLPACMPVPRSRIHHAANLSTCCRLSVAECGRVQGLYLTKQLFLAMVSVCLMLAADRANVVSGVCWGCSAIMLSWEASLDQHFSPTKSAEAPTHLAGITQVAATFDGALKASAQATLAGQVVTIICNLIMASLLPCVASACCTSNPLRMRGAAWQQSLARCSSTTTAPAILHLQVTTCPSLAPSPLLLRSCSTLAARLRRCASRCPMARTTSSCP